MSGKMSNILPLPLTEFVSFTLSCYCSVAKFDITLFITVVIVVVVVVVTVVDVVKITISLFVVSFVVVVI